MEICISSVASLSSLLRSVLFARKRREGIGRPPLLRRRRSRREPSSSCGPSFLYYYFYTIIAPWGFLRLSFSLPPPRGRCLEIVDQSLEIRVERISKSVLSAAQQSAVAISSSFLILSVSLSERQSKEKHLLLISLLSVAARPV